MVAAPTKEGKALGRNSELVRQHNLSAVLLLVHRNQEISRSALAQQTGLNRSTISDLVEELKTLGLVTEDLPATVEGKGRPSLVVAADPNVVAFSVHPEFDYLEVAAVSFDGNILFEERVSYNSSNSALQVVREAARLIEKITKQLNSYHRVLGVGVAVPGQVRIADGVVRLAPHLGWEEVPLGKMLQDLCGLPVFIDNDASLGCTAESVYGAARNFSDLVYIFGGSGIGGGVITGGTQLRGSTGYGSELGHVRISSDSNPDYSGIPGTIEALVRREDLEKVLKVKNVDDNELEAALLRNRSEPVRVLVEKQINALAAAIANYANIFNPQIVVLAGFLPALYWYNQDLMLEGIRKGCLPAVREGLVVKPGELGSNILVVGAAELPFSALITNPNGFQLLKPGSKLK
ncbi:MAG: ROK family protein [Micrococcales bacterium]